MSVDRETRSADVTEPHEPRADRHRPPGWLAVPLLVFAGSRIAQLMVLSWMHPAKGRGSAGSSLYDRLFAWDGAWFLRIAEQGYPSGYTYGDDGRLIGNGLAFFPGYPFAVRLAHEVTRLPYAESALVVSWLAGAVAAVVVYRLGVRLYDARVGTALAVLFCTQPLSVALGMAYSEGLFVAFAAGTLLAAHRRAWLTAGVLGLLAGLSRPTGVAVAAALAVAAFAELRRPGASRWRPVVAAVVAACGVPAYLLFVAVRVGTWHAWFDIQTAGWGSTFDFGASTARFVTDTLRGDNAWVPISVALILIAAVVSAAVAAFSRVWPPLLVYGLVALALVVGQSGYFHSKPRLLLPVLLVLIPPAAALGRARPRAAALALAGWALFGFWYGAHMLTVWPYAI